MKTQKIVVVLALALGLATTASAADLTLTGNSAVEWAKAQIGTLAFSDGDNVLISSEHFTGPSLTMKARVNPGDVVFDIDRNLLFGWSNSGYGLGVDTKSFTKRGSGTLLLTSNSQNASGDTSKGNTMTCGVEIVEGEIACKDANSHNYLGPRTIPYWVNVRNGAALTFLERNQTGSPSSTECGIKIFLDAGGRLNICTNKTTASGHQSNFLCVNTLELAGGDIAAGAGAYYTANGSPEAGLLGGKCTMKIYNALAFSGETPHAFGFPDGRYTGYKHYSSDFLPGKISLNAYAPVEFRVNDVDDGDGVDAYVNMEAFTWGTNTVGQYRADIVKTGTGTLCFPTNSVSKNFLGDFTVKEGTALFDFNGTAATALQFFMAKDSDSLQTVTVSTNAAMRITKRNITGSSWSTMANVKIVVDHGSLKYDTGSETSRAGVIRARHWVFDDATVNVSSPGNSGTLGVLYFIESATFRGTRKFELMPDPKYIIDNQAIHVHYDPRTVFDVAEMTGDGRTDAEIGFRIWDGGDGTALANRKASGFVKTGSGTLSLSAKNHKVSGVVTVSNGVLRVDGSLVTPSRMEVAAGAYLGGTGTVTNVSLEAGAGFSAPAGETSPLTVSGDLVLPSTGVIDIANLDGVDERDLPETEFVTATGTLSGAENLENWTVKVNGSVSSKWRLMVDDGVVKAKVKNGLTIVFR